MSNQKKSRSQFDLIVAGQQSIAVIGLGYVGLPLACLLAKRFKVIGFDIDSSRVSQLRDRIDITREIANTEDLDNPNLKFTCDSDDVKEASLFIVAVPTPIDKYKKPDLGPILSASETIGKVMALGSTIVYESTVYPGLTENECRQTLEKASGFEYPRDFKLGYSPERVNPGDREHTIDKIVKVVSACDSETLDLLDSVYSSVVEAGIFRASSIATAEAAKVIENTQRDINIALINELAVIFERVGLDTREVLEAAGTKWNFLKFKPGLVGGHCIGVDPYYLTHLAEGVGIHPRVILSGRQINDDMAKFVAEKTVRMVLPKLNADSKGKIKVGILGVTFKENVPDLRNTKVIELACSLEEFGVQVDIVDPVVHAEDFKRDHGRQIIGWDSLPPCDALVLAVDHEELKPCFKIDCVLEKLSSARVVVDLVGAMNVKDANEKGVSLWRL